MKRLAVGLVTCALLSTACGAGNSSAAAPPSSATAGAIQASGTVAVLYAGSLVNMMEHDVGPGFQKATGATFAGTGAGSTQLVSEIKGKVKRGDVFISASKDANAGLVGAANGDWETWYATFATAPLEIGYNPDSKFVNDLKTKPWQQVITEPGFRTGSTDPKLDPKGKLAAQALSQAGVPAGAVQVFPEEQLVGRLQSGQLDAGFFYSSEATELKIPTVTLGESQLKATYTVTVLNNAPNASGANGFVRYLFSADGLALMRRHGLVLQPVTVTGDKTAVPKDLDTALGVK